ncbi:Ff.00g093610.m01.CDS01 [Fusarium sp. VM40]|nr:Ff.00g093610.m01.CDS01 [Fusarium sp. VM40]
MARSVDDESESEIVPGFGAMTLTPRTSSDSTNKSLSLLQQWNNYFQKGTLEDSQRLCADLGVTSDLPSKTKCREALKSVNVNIKQFLECDNKPDGVMLFKSRNALIRWTFKNHAVFPKRQLPQGSPLRTLLKEIFNSR